MEDFTFFILAYNQEDMIVETLESIKYQIEKYGKNISCNLIVIDDCSKDSTVTVVRKWTEQNAYLFNEIDIHVNEQNQGVVNNHNWGLDHIKTKYFKELAGDDLFSSGNFFKIYDGFDDRTVRSYVCTELCGDRIVYDDMRLKLYYYNKLHKREKKYDLVAMRAGMFFHTPSTIFTKDLYDFCECRKFNSKFRNFEDDPSWYMMVKKHDDISIEFIDDIIVLYRIHEKSISTSKTSEFSAAFMAEVRKLHAAYYEDCTGFEKLIMWFRKTEGIHKIFKLDKYYLRLRRMYINIWADRNQEYKLFNKAMLERFKAEEEYYKYIKEQADLFYGIV